MIHVSAGAAIALMLMASPVVGSPARAQGDGTVRIFVFPRTQPELEKSEKKRLVKEAVMSRRLLKLSGGSSRPKRRFPSRQVLRLVL